MEAGVIVHDALVPVVVALGRRDAERIGVDEAQGLSFEEPGRDQRAAGRARPRRQARGAPEMRRPAGVRPRRREGDAGACATRAFLRWVRGVARLPGRGDFELPLTLRGVSSTRWCSASHDPERARRCSTGRGWRSVRRDRGRMGRSIAAEVAARLIAAGLSPDTAVAVVECQPARQKHFHGTLADLPSLENRADLTGPVMTIIGDAVAGAEFQQVGSAGGAFAASVPKRCAHEGADCQPADRQRGRLVRRRRWIETLAGAGVAQDKGAEDEYEAVGKAVFALLFTRSMSTSSTCSSSMARSFPSPCASIRAAGPPSPPAISASRLASRLPRSSMTTG